MIEVVRYLKVTPVLLQEIELFQKLLNI